MIVKDNQLEAAFTYAGDSPLMRLDEQGNAVYYLTDAIGSVIALVDGNGEKIADFSYDSFGNLQTSGELPLHLGGDFRFQGQWLESNTDFYHFRARYYDPQTGRFLSRDPVEVIETVPQSSNPYQFVYNNPLIYSDPTGLYTISEVNVNRIIQDLLSAMRTEVVDALKQNAIDKAQGIVGDLVSRFISTVAPDISAYGEIANLALNTPPGPDQRMGLDYIGNITEEFIMDIGVCPVLTATGLDRYLWKEPTITRGGKPTHDGSQCNEEGSPSPRRQRPRPDFAISAFPPKTLKTSFTARKAWLVGDIKTTTAGVERHIDRNHNQWQAIKNFAKTRQYVPSALYITFFDDGNRTVETRLENEALSQGVILRILPLISRP
ncbi:MAG: RHS repeat-associated core domain-containing protein [Kamptonema sp. SIO1D9]|nr:RHS repeat-associated core domain-containing protein [Kamptonema sp. SIO1D9]